MTEELKAKSSNVYLHFIVKAVGHGSYHNTKAVQTKKHIAVTRILCITPNMQQPKFVKTKPH